MVGVTLSFVTTPATPNVANEVGEECAGGAGVHHGDEPEKDGGMGGEGIGEELAGGEVADRAELDSLGDPGG